VTKTDKTITESNKPENFFVRSDSRSVVATSPLIQLSQGKVNLRRSLLGTYALQLTHTSHHSYIRIDKIMLCQPNLHFQLFLKTRNSTICPVLHNALNRW